MFKKILALNLVLFLAISACFYCFIFLPLTSNNDSSVILNSETTYHKYVSDMSKASEDIKVMTYNVHGLPHKDSLTCDNLIHIGKLLKKLRESENSPDVIAIQEGFHEKTYEMIKLSGYPYVAKGPDVDFKSVKINSGLWILSKYPVKKIKNISYESCATWDCWSNKGVQLVSIEASEFSFQLYNTHMNAYSEYDAWTEKSKIDAAKNKQIVQFKSFLASTKSKKSPNIIVGDFNFIQNSRFYTNFISPDLYNSIIQIAGTMPKKLLDHQYFIQGEGMRVAPTLFKRLFSNKAFSDHDAILVDYKLHK